MVFFFKQKTAYEMRISDWSSDVCSSDLKPEARRTQQVIAVYPHQIGRPGKALQHRGDQRTGETLAAFDDIELPAPVFAVELPRRGQRTNNPCPNGNARAGNARASGDVRLPGIKRLTAGNTRRKNGQCFRSEEHTSELQSLMRNSYDVFCLKK